MEPKIMTISKTGKYAHGYHLSFRGMSLSFVEAGRGLVKIRLVK
jgi:hypothetical protein